MWGVGGIVYTFKHSAGDDPPWSLGSGNTDKKNGNRRALSLKTAERPHLLEGMEGGDLWEVGGEEKEWSGYGS